MNVLTQNFLEKYRKDKIKIILWTIELKAVNILPKNLINTHICMYVCSYIIQTIFYLTHNDDVSIYFTKSLYEEQYDVLECRRQINHIFQPFKTYW